MKRLEDPRFSLLKIRLGKGVLGWVAYWEGGGKGLSFFFNLCNAL